jgi:hypothetical protein
MEERAGQWLTRFRDPNPPTIDAIPSPQFTHTYKPRRGSCCAWAGFLAYGPICQGFLGTYKT